MRRTAVSADINPDVGVIHASSKKAEEPKEELKDSTKVNEEVEISINK